MLVIVVVFALLAGTFGEILGFFRVGPDSEIHDRFFALVAGR